MEELENGNENTTDKEIFSLKTTGAKIAVFIAVIAAVAIVLGVFSYATTGQLTKVFSKTVLPGQTIENNITVRKFYNLTVRFRTSVNGSDLSFTDSDATVALKDAAGKEIVKATGVVNGKIYTTIDRLNLDMIETTDATSIGSYGDVVNQAVTITLSGTKAYLTIVVEKKQGNATIAGYVTDELTSQAVDGVNVLAFENNADPNTASIVAEDTSENGRYSLMLATNADGKTYDIYVSGYTTG